MLNKDLFRKKRVEDLLGDSDWDNPAGQNELVRTLTLRDLTSFGIAAIVGAGIFGTIGNASAAGGPAVSLLFIFTAIACLLSALCYAEFASAIPVTGSAYSYAYHSFGEIIAWIIGWDLLMEYAIGNIAVAISWSDYFTSFISGLGIHFPENLTMDFLSARRGFAEVTSSVNVAELPPFVIEAANAWKNAPEIAGVKIIFDFPALLITVFVTWLVYLGMKESRTTGNILVVIKLIVLFFIIAVGAFYVNPENWSPFAPNGVAGILKGVSAVFFAYIGFDAISTTAEECKNPRTDLPRSMFYSLLICTLIYVAITFVLTGMVSYTELAVGDPLAYVFERKGLNIFSGIIALSAIVAMTSVLLVFQLGQPRIWLAMSRDGLLPEKFSKIHPLYKTPSFSTIVTGFVVAVPAMFMNLTEVTDLCSIGTLFAFVIVCAGVLVKRNKREGAFIVPYINGKFIVPVLYFTFVIVIYFISVDKINNIFSREILFNNILMVIYFLIAGVISYLTYKNNFSLIPVLGLLFNLYLMTELGLTNWSRFLLWLLLGLVIYFIYGYRKSKLNN